jgi:delta14-sterol reductase
MPIFFAPVTIETFLYAILAESAFVLLLAAGSLLLPGGIHHGAPGPDGRTTTYKLNGLLLFVIAVGCAIAGQLTGLFSLAIIPPQGPSLLLAANVLAFSASAVLMLRSRNRGPSLLADYFYGRDGNPRWLGLDLKMFSYRPSLIGLGLMNLSLAALQVSRHGHITPQMALYQILFIIYLGNYFQFESGMLYTWDVVAENFGWMLVWGDYVLVPFFYSLPGWYLVDDLRPISTGAASTLVILYSLGFLLFRGANGQKHRFKQDRHVRIWGAPAKTLEGRLLVSGFWGIGRKLNYTGELCMYWSWTLLCGFESMTPYLVPLWLTCLLHHRAWRDEKRCRAKYGKLWDDYCAHAKFRMIPFVY